MRLFLFLPRALSILLLTLLLAPSTACGQEQLDTMSIEDFEPRSSLVVPENPISRARFPFVDVHSHWFRAPRMTAGAIDTLIAEMDGMNMAVVVNLSGGWGDNLAAAVRNMEARYPNRIVTFANLNFDGIGTPGWIEKSVAQLRTDVAAGARGLKIYKNLGMDLMDTDGRRVAVDDPRIDPIWALCGELGIPVLIHSADPAGFWQPRDRFNEKWLELKLRPGRYRPADKYPPFEQIIAEQHNVFRNHPETKFIDAHLGWMGNDLGSLGALLDEMPNVYTEVGAVIYELGRQPRAAHDFLVKYKDRVMMGKDSYSVPEYDTYFRTLETADEYFPYYRKYHAQWRMYGLDLPDDVLRALYFENAARVIPGIDASLFRN